MEEFHQKTGASKFVTVVFIILGILVGAGGVWYYMDKKASDDKVGLQAQVDTLAAEVATLKAASTSATAATSTTSTDTTADATAGWKTYTDSVVGFTFKYPPTVVMSAQSSKTSDTIMTVTTVKMADIQDMPYGNTKANAQADKTAIASGDPSTAFDMAVDDSYKLLSISGAIGKEYTVLRMVEACDVQFSRIARIYKGDYLITVNLEKHNTSGIISGNPAYFKTDATNCGASKIWANSDLFYSDLPAGKTDTLSQTWYNNFDTMLGSLHFN